MIQIVIFIGVSRYGVTYAIWVYFEGICYSTIIAVMQYNTPISIHNPIKYSHIIRKRGEYFFFRNVWTAQQGFKMPLSSVANLVFENIIAMSEQILWNKYMYKSCYFEWKKKIIMYINIEEKVSTVFNPRNTSEPEIILNINND